MPGIQTIIDPNEAPLAFSAANGFYLFSPIKCVPAQSDTQWTSNSDTEGELPVASKSKNAELTPKLRIAAATEKAFREAQTKLEQKIDKLQREGGVLRFIYPDGSIIDWEVRGVTGGERLIDNAFIASFIAEDELTFICAPFGVGEEELVGEFTGEAKRLLECIVEGIGGSALALGRVVVTSPEADVWDLKWGRESRRLSEAATAKCLFAASTLTPLGGATATTATVDGKAGTSVVRQATLTPNWTAQLSTQIPGVGQMTHEGVYEVFVWIHMPATNTGEIGVGFEYAVGDLIHRTEGDAIYFAADHSREGKVICLSVGQVFLRASGNGAHQWEGRVLTKSSVTGDDFDILDVGILPVLEGNGSMSIEPTFNQPAALLIRDEFGQTAGNLNEKLLGAATAISAPKSPSTVVEDASVGTVAWSNLANAKASDDTYASSAAMTTNGEQTKYLKATKYGLAVPVGATVTGIALDLERNQSGNFRIEDASIKLVKAGAIVGTDHAVYGLWATTDTVARYGSENDLWGTTWTAEQINAEGFGVAISAKRGVGPPGTSVANIDVPVITIYYTDAAGQKWATSGDAVDLAVEITGHTAQRTEVSDADINTGRYAVAGTTVTSDIVAGLKAKRSALKTGASERIRQGVMVRYVDNSNWLFFGPDVEALSSPVTDRMRVIKRVGGTVTELDRVTIPEGVDWRSVWLQVDRRGRYFCWATLLESGLPRLLSAGQDNDLKEGGVLDDGKVGFQDAKTGANANTRNYDQFVAWIPALDAVIYQGLALELTDDACRRQGTNGNWSDLVPRGDYLKLAPAEMENRKNRLVFIPSSNDPDTMGVGFPSKLKVAIYATPRHRTLPDPA